MSGDITCCKCDYKRGHPNQPNGTFICSDCKMGYDNSIERDEARFGA